MLSRLRRYGLLRLCRGLGWMEDLLGVSEARVSRMLRGFYLEVQMYCTERVSMRVRSAWRRLDKF